MIFQILCRDFWPTGASERTFLSVILVFHYGFIPLLGKIHTHILKDEKSWSSYKEIRSAQIYYVYFKQLSLAEGCFYDNQKSQNKKRSINWRELQPKQGWTGFDLYPYFKVRFVISQQCNVTLISGHILNLFDIQEFSHFSAKLCAVDKKKLQSNTTNNFVINHH